MRTTPPTLKLHRNENPYGPLSSVHKALEDIGRRMGSYPTDETELVQELASRWGWPPEGILLGNGSESLIQLFAMMHLQEGKRGLVMEASFPQFKVAIRRQQAGVRSLELGADWLPDPGQVLETSRGADALFLCSPDNPTGLELDRGELLKMLKTLPPGLPVLLDQAYADFSENAPTLQDLRDLDRPNLCLIRTFSKLHGLAGLRLGVLLTSPTLASRMRILQSPFQVNAAAIAAGLASLRDPGTQAVSRRIVEDRERLKQGLRELGFTPLDGRGNFVTFPCPQGHRLASRLEERGILVLDATSFGLPDHLRVSVGTWEECTHFLAVLESLLPNSP